MESKESRVFWTVAQVMKNYQLLVGVMFFFPIMLPSLKLTAISPHRKSWMAWFK